MGHQNRTHEIFTKQPSYPSHKETHHIYFILHIYIYIYINTAHWNVPSMSLVRNQPSGEAPSLSIQPKGKTLYSEAIELVGHTGASLCAKFSRSGELIASSGVDKSVLIWQLPTQYSAEQEGTYGVLSGHKSAVTSVRWLNDDLTLVTSSADRTIGFWDTTTGARIRKCAGHELCVNEVSVSSQSTDLALSVADDGWCCMWDKRQKSPTMEIETEYPLLTGCFNNQGTAFYTAGIEPVVRAYDVRDTTKPVWECSTAPENESITSLAINNEDSMLVSRSINGLLGTYSAKEFVPEGISRANLSLYHGAPSGNEQQLIRCCFSNDNVSILSGSEDKTITVWEVLSRKIQRKMDGHRSTVIGIDHHPTEKIVASTSVDGTVIVREL